jgi:predicted transcriptional regulator
VPKSAPKKTLVAFRLEDEVLEALDRIADELTAEQPRWRSNAKVSRTEALRAAVLGRADKKARHSQSK